MIGMVDLTEGNTHRILLFAWKMMLLNGQYLAFVSGIFWSHVKVEGHTVHEVAETFKEMKHQFRKQNTAKENLSWGKDCSRYKVQAPRFIQQPSKVYYYNYTLDPNFLILIHPLPSHSCEPVRQSIIVMGL